MVSTNAMLMADDSNVFHKSSIDEDDDMGSISVDEEDNSEGLTHSDGPAGNSSHAASQDSDLAKVETRALKRSKIILLVFMASTALLAAGLAYYFSRKAETEDFEQQFDVYAAAIEDMVHLEVHNAIVSVNSVSHTITSHTQATNATWPYIVLPDFEIRGNDVIASLSSITSVAFSPILSLEHREAYEVFTTYNQGWIADGIRYATGQEPPQDLPRIPDKIYRFLENGAPHVIEDDFAPFLPIWQQFPVPKIPRDVNFNKFSMEEFARVYVNMEARQSTVISKAVPLSDISLDMEPGSNVTETNLLPPYSLVFGPVYNSLSSASSIVVGIVSEILDWRALFTKLLAVNSYSVMAVMQGSCGDVFSFDIRGETVEFLGYEDLHDDNEAYLRMARSTLLDPRTMSADDECVYELSLYPTEELENAYRTNQPIIYATGMIFIFLFTAAAFLVYDMHVHRRQANLVESAAKSAAIVSSLFPKNVTDRMMKELEDQKVKDKSSTFRFVPKNQIKDFLNNGSDKANPCVYDTKPIADLFPETTVLFADIVGFTAWSSVREPSQVFILLETLYASFDLVAKRRRIFKVETIGDCYVAVTGLPEPRKDHATAMTRFAKDILNIMDNLTKELEVTLGPDTGDLSLRIGLHSGPVTAGVLRGDKSRFQLFGDTVNTAARMESHGVKGRIHISSDTAELLKAGAKSNWIIQRQDKIVAKGKGEMTTFWVVEPQKYCPSNTSDSSHSEDDSPTASETETMQELTENTRKNAIITGSIEAKPIPAKLQRLVRWNADVLLRNLKLIVARRNAINKFSSRGPTELVHQISSSPADISRSGTVLDEVKEVIALPQFDAKAAKNQQDPKTVELDKAVVDQLHNYVTVIASLYHEDVPFHNFEHASHVTMSVVKLLSRIVAPEDVLTANEEDDNVMFKNLHDHTYGITSDPLTQFAVVLSALIHDVDHSGVANVQLIKEGSRLAEIYKGKSIAEQNSVDIAMDLLMDDCFADLRAAIYATESERKRFRQLVVNTVMATDIVDPSLKDLRNARWEKAFQKKHLTDEVAIQEDVNRKATIVIEHLIQASDVAHTMQHWHIYRKWNENFFFENLKAFREGRAERDPTEFWYKGEIGFFDYYIIPLAKKLKECGVFGVSCDEYLNYALANRKEWECRGEEAVEEMVEKFKELYNHRGDNINDNEAA